MLNAVLSYVCDMDRGIDRTLIRPALLTGDKQAHTFRIAVSRSGEDASLTGASVSAYFVRADGVTVPITGSAEGSAAVVTLPEGCYRVPGRFQLVVKLSMDSGISTIFWGDGAVASSSTDAIIDEEDVIPSLDELLAQIAAAEAAAANASSAASSANTAAIRANAAAASIEQVSAQATTLTPGSEATAAWSTVDGAKVLTIGVPQGIQGPQGPKGEPGKDGSGSVSTVNGVEPVQGNVTLTASDVGARADTWVPTAAEVGALPEDGTAADAAMLGGKAPAYYLQPRNLLDNSNFRSPVNQRGASSYTTAGAYGIDRWSQRTSSSVTVNSGSITVTGKIKQRLLSAAQGGTYTLAAGKADGSVTILTTHGWDNDAGCYYVELPAGEYVWAALYEGSYTADTLPPYVSKGYAAELAECQRYYNSIPYDMDDYSVNANTAYPSIYPVSFPEMRIIPTVTLKESWNTGSAGVSVGFITKSSLAFQAAATSSRVAWHGKIELNADL